MKKIEVTNQLERMVSDLRDTDVCEREGLNLYYELMERIAMAKAGLAKCLEVARTGRNDECVNHLCEAIILFGKYAELLNQLKMTRDQDYDEFVLKKITDNDDEQ